MDWRQLIVGRWTRDTRYWQSVRSAEQNQWQHDPEGIAISQRHHNPLPYCVELTCALSNQAAAPYITHVSRDLWRLPMLSESGTWGSAVLHCGQSPYAPKAGTSRMPHGKARTHPQIHSYCTSTPDSQECASMYSWLTLLSHTSGDRVALALAGETNSYFRKANQKINDYVTDRDCHCSPVELSRNKANFSVSWTEENSYNVIATGQIIERSNTVLRRGK